MLFLAGSSLPLVVFFERSIAQLTRFDNARAVQMMATSMAPAVELQQQVEAVPSTETNSTLLPPVKEIYCICPAGSQTGGPEALHQLCNEVNLAQDHNVNASMLYVQYQRGGTVAHVPTAEEPKRYKDLYHSQVATTSDPLTRDSSPDKLLIWPEIMVDQMMEYLNNSSNPCQCAIYWLSVDKYKGSFKEWHREDILHLGQSEYARQFVMDKGATNVFPLKEYIPRIPKKLRKEDRTIDVIYNPKKGIEYTNAIRERSGSQINFHAIAPSNNKTRTRRRRRRGNNKLSPEQVQSMLRKSKVYIDFGGHPGMDRIPREAALAGCIVVTNRKGSAGFRQDVPIPSQYKIKDFDVDAIHELLIDLVNNYETHTKQFRRYRVWIRGQRKRMKQQVAAFLDEVAEKRESASPVIQVEAVS